MGLYAGEFNALGLEHEFSHLSHENNIIPQLLWIKFLGHQATL
jgi:hypothetical protein